MEFVKKHYEKILLGAVLLGLTIAVALLPVMIGVETSKLAELRDKKLRLKVAELPKPPMELEDAALQRAQTEVHWDFTKDHNLLNPVLWQRDGQGALHKSHPGQELSGPGALEVTRVRPLYLRLDFNGTNGSSYVVDFANETATGSKARGERLARMNEKNDLFTLKDVTGPPGNPSEIILEMSDETHERVAIGPGKPFQRVEGYVADLRYPPEGRSFSNQRKGSIITLGGVPYKIIAITEADVIVSAPNDKKTTIHLNVVPSTPP